MDRGSQSDMGLLLPSESLEDEKKNFQPVMFGIRIRLTRMVGLINNCILTMAILPVQ